MLVYFLQLTVFPDVKMEQPALVEHVYADMDGLATDVRMVRS